VRILDRFFGPPSAARFARRLADAIRRAGERSSIRYDPEEFRLVVDGDVSNVMNLANLYGEYRATPRARRPLLLQAFVRSWFDRYKEIPELYEDLGPDLLPSLRPRMFHEAARLEAELTGTPSLELPHRVVGQHYAAGLMYDLPQSMMLVQSRHLQCWRVSLDEALDAACDNLLEISRQPWPSPAPGVWASPWHDHYDAARLLILPDLIDPDDVAGDLVAMVPNRDTLLVAGAEDDKALAVLIELAEAALKDPRPIHGFPLRRASHGWVPFVPEPGRPGAERFRLLRMNCLGHDYTEQAGLLNQLSDRRGGGPFAASFSAMQNTQTGESVSYCVWSEGVPTLLPETDRVIFHRPGGESDGRIVTSGDWDHVRQVVGDQMTPLGLYPERYRVEAFPTSAQLAEIGDE
jgi:hypothetical protein